MRFSLQLYEGSLAVQVLVNADACITRSFHESRAGYYMNCMNPVFLYFPINNSAVNCLLCCVQTSSLSHTEPAFFATLNTLKVLRPLLSILLAILLRNFQVVNHTLMDIRFDFLHIDTNQSGLAREFLDSIYLNYP